MATIKQLEAAGWDFEGPCIATILSNKGRTVVRRNRDGRVAVLWVDASGAVGIAKELPTAERARAYQDAMHR